VGVKNINKKLQKQVNTILSIPNIDGNITINIEIKAKNNKQ